jgi:hypothetical protein
MERKEPDNNISILGIYENETTNIIIVLPLRIGIGRRDQKPVGCLGERWNKGGLCIGGKT